VCAGLAGGPCTIDPLKGPPARPANTKRCQGHRTPKEMAATTALQSAGFRFSPPRAAGAHPVTHQNGRQGLIVAGLSRVRCPARREPGHRRPAIEINDWLAVAVVRSAALRAGDVKTGTRSFERCQCATWPGFRSPANRTLESPATINCRLHLRWYFRNSAQKTRATQPPLWCLSASSPLFGSPEWSYRPAAHCLA